VSILDELHGSYDAVFWAAVLLQGVRHIENFINERFQFRQFLEA
jgi:hypothetical protein